jgi:hypothetical protein
MTIKTKKRSSTTQSPPQSAEPDVQATLEFADGTSHLVTFDADMTAGQFVDECERHFGLNADTWVLLIRSPTQSKVLDRTTQLATRLRATTGAILYLYPEIVAG